MLLSAKPDDWYWLVVSILITWRLGCLVCYDEGPFQVMMKIRKLFYQFHWNSLVECFHCVALWISILVGVTVFEPGYATVFLIIGIAGGASVIERWLHSDPT